MAGFSLPTLTLGSPCPEDWTSEGYCWAIIQAGIPTRVGPDGAALVPGWAGAVASAGVQCLTEDALTFVLQAVRAREDRLVVGTCARLAGPAGLLPLLVDTLEDYSRRRGRSPYSKPPA